MPINSFLYPGPTNSNPYVVDNSVRFNDGDSPRLLIANPTAGTRTKGTFSTWFKRCTFGAYQYLFSTWNNSASGYTSGVILLQNDDRLSISNYVASGASGGSTLITERKFRDPSAWYHVVIAWDTTDGTAADRYKIYVNGTRETVFNGTPAYPTSNQDLFFQAGGTSNPYHIGFESVGSDRRYFDGYLAETVLVDGSALAASSFGEFDSSTPTVWKPKDVSGLTFGSQGFYLDYEDSGDLGDDESGNGNDFTETNLAATDQSTDTCTNNFATLNSLTKTSYTTLAEGNLESFGNTSSDQGHSDSTISASSGKWYAEVKVIAANTTGGTATYPRYGIRHINNKEYGRLLNGGNGSPGNYFDNEGLYQSNGEKFVDASNSSFGNSFAANDIIGIAVDYDNGAVYFSKNGTFQNSGNTASGASKTGALVTWTPADLDGFVFCSTEYNDSKSHWNFGNPVHSISSGNSDANGYGNFEYAVPSGYYALNTKNLAEYGG